MITAGYLALHARPSSGARDVALLDVCQDYVLDFLNNQGVFDLGVVLKGGTSLRKFRAGSAGRFSTDLDFSAPDVATAEFVIDTLDGAEHHGVRPLGGPPSSSRGTLSHAGMSAWGTILIASCGRWREVLECRFSHAPHAG
ncbi:MAG: nucleotidyl transferase AbiEii/AbiGii toxin family protein [Actinomycetota bacterium]|nr:nucleotidyl transferase AbiEii/AbiGii toxin family protein [Actinomycetota bacterium]